MTTPSPSEFLTFMRHAAVRSSIRPSTIRQHPSISQSLRIATARSLHTSPAHSYASAVGPGVKTDQYGSKEHATDKKENLNIEFDAVHKAKAAKGSGTGGAATSQSDERGSVDKAKKEFPEAPDTAIGMQDERGGKGR